MYPFIRHTLVVQVDAPALHPDCEAQLKFAVLSLLTQSAVLMMGRTPNMDVTHGVCAALLCTKKPFCPLQRLDNRYHCMLQWVRSTGRQ